MTCRLVGVILLLYPRRVREGHGAELVRLIDDLIVQEGRSRIGLFMRLAVDGLVQRMASTAAAWSLVAVLATTSVGDLVVSDFAAARAIHRVPRAVQMVAPTSRTQQPSPTCPDRPAPTAGRLHWSRALRCVSH
jgi:hypothetical protein